MDEYNWDGEIVENNPDAKAEQPKKPSRHKMLVALIFRHVQSQHIKWPIEVKTADFLAKAYPPDFLFKIKPPKINSLLWFRSEAGKRFLEREYAMYLQASQRSIGAPADIGETLEKVEQRMALEKEFADVSQPKSRTKTVKDFLS